MAKLVVVLCMAVLLATVEHRVEATVVRLLTDFIQNNVAGIPLIHKTEEYDFDPEISKKRRELYYELHGYRGEKVIERLGLGIDGKHHERLAHQRQRDEGHLQGLNYLQP
ncbi:AGAP005312-PA-like protein [Anopheles sinensis]|uniref:AGAP005312-PA-like protein n=1 Tax=Anopheles sinensis TaxID=74873 RepID=A0A084W2I2_ANOSI|nr:AGAP005312-PA-like protein [Anopheles sinensis]